MIIPLPTIFLASFCQKKQDYTNIYKEYVVEIRSFKLFGINWGYWVDYPEEEIAVSDKTFPENNSIQEQNLDLKKVLLIQN